MSKTSIMAMEWVLGITDEPPKHWPKRTHDEILPFDEQLTITSSHTFHDLVSKLCETALKKRRGEDDCDIDYHLWNLKIFPVGEPEEPVRPIFPDSDDDSEDDEDDDDASESKYRGRILIAPAEHIQGGFYEEEEGPYELIPSSETLSLQLLPKNYVIHFTYDFGSTTNLYLRVLHVRPAGAQKLLGYFETALGPGKSEQDQDLKAVPAYHLPKERQIDTFYPHFSQAFIGQYVPLQKRRNSQDDDGGGGGGGGGGYQPRVGIGSATLGLSSRISSEKDTTFCSMENADCSSDLFFAGRPFSDMSEFFQVAEKAWTPRDPKNDPDHLDNYEYGMVSRHAYPSSADADEVYKGAVEYSKSQYAQYGPKRLFFRLEPEELQQKQSDFDFAKVFPKTHAHLQSGKFRWIKYKDGVLRVLVGRGTGHDFRGFGSNQVLRTWKRQFESLHELLCAVEASWVYKKKGLDADTVIHEFDLDLGPSKPGPKEPALLGTKEDALVVTKCNDAKKFVSALAIAEEADGKTVLYSGHADGTLTKWCLAENKQLWTKQVYPDGIRDYPHFCQYTGVYLQGTAGVAGLVVRNQGAEHLIYTWSDAYDGYPESDFENRGPSKVKCWQGKDGSYVRSYACDVGLDEQGKPAHPSIAAVVFCRLCVKGQWVESMLVGLHCLCRPLICSADYSDFDIDEAQGGGEGNILPFYEHSNGTAMETWRGHMGIVQALAVISDQYLFSYSVLPGHGSPDAMMLWSLEEPGVPLYRHDLWDPSRSLLKQSLTRLYSVAGIGVSGTDVLLASDYGDRIAVVSVEKDRNGDPFLKLHGYGNIGNRCYEDGGFHGRMAMSGKQAVMANEGVNVAWLFDIEGNAGNDKLDRREGNRRNFDDRYDDDDDDDDDEKSKYRFSGREIAIGIVEFPLFGGTPPRRKKKRVTMTFGFGSVNEPEEISESEDFDEGVLWTIDKKSDGLGEGGPIALAMCGKWLVAGFSNGSIVRAPHLPPQFEATACPGSSGVTSWSSLPPGEWHVPVLEIIEQDADDEEDESEDDENEGSECSIQ